MADVVEDEDDDAVRAESGGEASAEAETFAAGLCAEERKVSTLIEGREGRRGRTTSNSLKSSSVDPLSTPSTSTYLVANSLPSSSPTIPFPTVVVPPALFVGDLCCASISSLSASVRSRRTLFALLRGQVHPEDPRTSASSPFPVLWEVEKRSRERSGVEGREANPRC